MDHLQPQRANKWPLGAPVYCYKTYILFTSFIVPFYGY